MSEYKTAPLTNINRQLIPICACTLCKAMHSVSSAMPVGVACHCHGRNLRPLRGIGGEL